MNPKEPAAPKKTQAKNSQARKTRAKAGAQPPPKTPAKAKTSTKPARAGTPPSVPIKKSKDAYHHGDLKEALITAALALVAERGPNGFTMREAARSAGVSPGAPYRHFADKTDLLTHIAEGSVDLLNEYIQRQIKKMDPSNPLETYRAIGIGVVVFAAENPARYRVMTDPQYTTSEYQKKLQQENVAKTRELLAAAQASGVLAERHIDEIILTAEALVNGLAYMFMDGVFAARGIGPEQAEAIAIQATGVLGFGFVPRRK